MVVDVSAFQNILPILTFLLVFVVTFVVLAYVKIFEGPWIHAFISFLIATIFVSVADARQYVENVVPWFGVLIVSLFLVLLMAGLVGKKFAESFSPVAGTIFVVVLFIVFLIAGIIVFSSQLSMYLPSSSTYGTGNQTITSFTDWLFSARVGGAILLLIVSALVSWVLVKGK